MILVEYTRGERVIVEDMGGICTNRPDRHREVWSSTRALERTFEWKYKYALERSRGCVG